MKLHFMAFACLACTLFCPALAFLPTKLNYSDPEVMTILCPEQMSGETWDHKAITREGIRREIRRFFLESPPPTNGTFDIPEDASLSQIFRYYYGYSSSPARFIKAVNSITWANAMTEASGQIRFETRHHMDGENIKEGHTLLQGRYQQLVSTIMGDEAYPFARELLGTSLNSIQDFYSQTTWIELGNTDILKELGFPGQDIPEVAAPGEATCTDCSNAQGECKNNVILDSKLSSGYYEYDVPGSAAFVVPKPLDAGKCSHGSGMDSSVSRSAVGGINKESTSPCFSPHHYLHQQAADLAISATEYYLSVLRDAIGDDYFRHLFDLYPGSALSIMIDTTGSMTGEISAVKAESKLIVEKTHPEFYVLTPYKDPGTGPVTATSNGETFLEKVDELDAYGGCCCTEENFWAALQLSLANTPDYSSIFCFTDAGANDRQLMEGSIALASAKHSQVTIIYSFDQTNSDTNDDHFCPEDQYTLSGVDEYKRLATETGGQFIEIDKFNIDDIMGILEDGVAESEVAIRMREGVTGSQKVDFPVDDSINYFQVLITGEVTSAVLTDGDLSIDLMNEETLGSVEGVEVILFSSTLKSIRFANLTIGSWELEVNSDVNEYSATVKALSTLGFLAEFCELVTLPPRPSYKLIRGRPLMNQDYYVEVTLVGYVDSQVERVTAMDFVDNKGLRLSHVDYTEAVDDHFFIRSEVLPATSFYIQVDGFLETGKQFSRLFPTMFVPVNCDVVLLVENSTLTARAGEEAVAYFRVSNYGPMAEFDYIASDEESFIKQFHPKLSTLEESGQVDIAVTFKVPLGTLPGTVSTVTVTAASRADENNVNSAITYFTVLPEEQDLESPMCATNDEPDCTGFTTPDMCADKNWTVVATLQDSKSGISRISSTPLDTLIVDEFSEGTTDPVTATLYTNCCVKEAAIYGVDGQGNIGRCEWEVADRAGGAVINFVAESVGETWVYLRWTVTDVREDLDKYTLVANSDFTVDSKCNDLVCHYNMTYLDPCLLQHFQLNPYFSHVKGPDSFTEATTLPSVISAPINPSTDYASETSTTVTWEGTIDNACLLGYEVCYRRYDSYDEHCVTVDSTTITLDSLEACTIYLLNIRAVAITGDRSEPLKHTTMTDEAAPGRPENLHMVNQTGRYSEIAWQDPLSHASCVDKWIVAHKPLNLTMMPSWGPKEIRIDETNTTYFTFDDLLGCNLYEYSVSAVSPSGLPGGTALIYAATGETEPRNVESVEATAVDPWNIDSSWDPALISECFDHYEVCLINTIAITFECFETNDVQMSFAGLEPCVPYEVSVRAVSPSGLKSGQKFTFATTGDVPTSPPATVGTRDVTAHSAVVFFDAPEENPLCVQTYNVRHINFDELTKDHSRHEDTSENAEEVIMNLEACTNYGVYVSVETVSGYVSEEVNVNFTTLVDTPSPPQALQIEGTAQDSVSFVWFAPQVNRPCAVSYHITYTSDSDSGDLIVERPDKPFELRVTVGDLAPCTSYNFGISAQASSGESSAPALIEATTSC